MKPVGEPYAGDPHVRFDERGRETEPGVPPRPPRPSSTLPQMGRGSRAVLVGMPTIWSTHDVQIRPQAASATHPSGDYRGLT